MLPRPLALEPELLARLMVWAGLGEPHVAVAGEPRWVADHDAEDRAAREQATALGLLDRRGRVDVDVAASLRVLWQATSEFYGWFSSGPRTVGVLAAATRGEAVLAVSDRETVWLSQAKTARLPETLIAQAAEVPAARGDVVRLRASATAEADAFGRATNAQVGLVERIAALPIIGAGELHVAVRDATGRRTQSPRPLRFTDTEHGRWLHHATPLPNGDETVEIAPASREELARRLRAAHRALTAG